MTENCINVTVTNSSMIAALLLLTACATPPVLEPQDGLHHAPPTPEDLAGIPDAVPQVEPLSRYGNPVSYEVFGKQYRTLRERTGYRERGIASWYGSKFHGRRTSSGEPYDMFAMTAAHKTLPLPSYARVTNLKNRLSVILKINDRGPFHDDRLIDLSYTAAWKLGIADEGTGLVEVEAIEPEAPNGLPEPTPLPELVNRDSSLPALFLQVGAFGNADNARRLKHRIETALQTEVRVEEHNIADALIYRVRVGPIASLELCDRLNDRLNGIGIPEARLVIR